MAERDGGEAITIRALGPDDLDLLCDVPEGLFDHPVRRDEAEGFLASPDCILVAAFDGPLMVSFASGAVLRHPDKAPSLFVNEVGTRDAHQRRGLATAVLRTLIGWARARGLHGIWVGTEPDNGPALALYRSLGAEEVPFAGFGWDGAFSA